MIKKKVIFAVQVIVTCCSVKDEHIGTVSITCLRVIESYKDTSPFNSETLPVVGFDLKIENKSAQDTILFCPGSYASLSSNVKVMYKDTMIYAYSPKYYSKLLIMPLQSIYYRLILNQGFVDSVYNKLNRNDEKTRNYIRYILKNMKMIYTPGVECKYELINSNKNIIIDTGSLPFESL